MSSEANVFKKGNKTIGLIIVLFLLLMIFSSTILGFLYNPFYLIQYVTTILLLGQSLNILFWLSLFSLALYWFMNFRLNFITKKRAFGYFLLALSSLMFITSVELLKLSFPVGKYFSIKDFYDITFITPLMKITDFSIWQKPLFSFSDLGMILPIFYWVFGLACYFIPLTSIIFILLIIYSINIIILDDYRFFFAKLNVFSKEKIDSNIQIEQIDLNQTTKEFEINFSKEEREKMELIERVRKNMDKKNYEELSEQIKKEREKLKSLRVKVLEKVKKTNEELRSKSKITDEQRKEIMGTFGYSSFSKLKMQSKTKEVKSTIVEKQINNQSITKEENINGNQELKSDGYKTVEETLDLSKKTLEEEFISDLANELAFSSDETQELPLIKDYYDEIFKKEDELVEEITKTLETIVELENEKTGETIIEKIEDGVSVDEYLSIPEDLIKLNKDNLEKKTIKEETVEEKIGRSIDWCKPYVLPSTSILSSESAPFNNQILVDESSKKAKSLNEVFSSFGIKANVNSFEIGPTVTTFKVELEAGIKTTKVTNLEDNIKLSLGVEYIRILAPIPGTSFIGIEVPNSTKKPVKFKTVYNETFDKSAGIQISIGQDVSGKSLSFDLSKAPHLLVAGSTGSGKSVAINTILASILLRYKPTDVQLVLIDPKMVEFAPYHGIPHLMTEVITDPSNANKVLQAMVQEMEDRYKLMAEKGVKKIEQLNKILISEDLNKVPYIVIVIDELADLMMASDKEVEDSIMRITQKARAAGIHMVIATQRPSTEIITGTIKSNIPSRMAFTVASSIDSRTILGTIGAEKLIGMGDMLVSLYGKMPFRGQGAYISNSEIEELTSYTKSQCSPDYIIDIEKFSKSLDFNNSLIDINDPVYIAAKDTVIHYQKASASMLQRHLNIGYNKAATIIDTLEKNEIIGPSRGSKPRKVLVEG